MNCPICNELIYEEFMNEHIDECLDQYDQCHYVEPVLTESQKNALRFASKKASIHSKQTRGLVLARFIKLGYTENDLNEVLTYVQFKCDVTINCNTSVLTTHIINSTHFKNGYEISRAKTYLESRTVWENNLFNNHYSNSEIIERPKYGALNLLQMSTGSAPSYGNSYFVLKPEVKKLITFVNGDSSLKMFHICTFDDPVALFIHLSDKYIELIVNIAKGNQCKSTHLNYIECQIHGMLRMSDFKKLYLCERECDAQQISNVKKFCYENCIEYDTI